MTLFFYGLVKYAGDEKFTCSVLQSIADSLGWGLDFERLKEFSLVDLFATEEEQGKCVVTFDLGAQSEDIYDLLYADYGGEQMLTYYRHLAQQLNIPDWENLEFGSLESVNQLYRKSPANLPIVDFMHLVFEQFPQAEVIFCLDEGFENRFDCQDISGVEQELLREAWLTIAFGYSWPNLRLKRRAMLA